MPTFADIYGLRAPATANFNGVANAIDGAVSVHWGGTTGGVANAYTASPSPAWNADVRSAARFLVVLVHDTNTGMTTIDVSGMGPVSVGRYNTELTGGELRANCLYVLAWNGSNYQIVTPTSMPPIFVDGTDVYINTLTKRNNSRLSVDFDGNASGAMGINDVGAVNGSVFIGFLSSGTFRGSITNNNNTAVAYNTTSDHRLKRHVRPLTGARERVRRYLCREWEWTDGGTGRGFVAHELAEVEPRAVTGEKDAVGADGTPIYQGVDPRFLVHDLVAVLQEELERADALEARLSILEAKLSA